MPSLSWKENSSPPYAQLLISCCFRSNHLLLLFGFHFFLCTSIFPQFCPPAKKFYFKAGSPRDDKRAREMEEKEIDRCLTFHHPSSLQLSLHLLLLFFFIFLLVPFNFFLLFCVTFYLYPHMCVVVVFLCLVSSNLLVFLFCLVLSFFRGGKEDFRYRNNIILIK